MTETNKLNTTIERRVDVKSELAEFREILYSHIEHFKNHELEEKKNYSEILRVQTDTNEKIAGMLEAWEIATNSIKALSLLGLVLKWVTGIVFGIGTIWTLYSGNLPLGK